MSDETHLTIDRARETYSERYELRAAVQAIPHIGGPLDTLIAGGYSLLQRRRIEDFVEQLQNRLATVEDVCANLEDEAFADLLVSSLEAAGRSRSAQKRARFASIVAHQVERGDDWEEPETATRLLADLDEIHIAVLELALQPQGAGVHTSPQVVDVRKAPDAPHAKVDDVHLPEALPQYSVEALRLTCSELSARGLLVDYGASKWGNDAMNSFVATDLGRWFMRWIREASSA